MSGEGFGSLLVTGVAPSGRSDAGWLRRNILKPSISVVIPAFNEEKNIDEVLVRAYKTMESYALPYEIILVDDGSRDRTKELASHHKVSIVCNDWNAGKGFALQRGFAHANGDIIITMDADGSHDPEDIPKLILTILKGADVVLGTRFGTKDGKESTKRLHILGNNMINFTIFLMTGKRITDSQTGFRAFTRSVLKQIEITSSGYQIESELTVKALRNGNVVEEVPIRAEKRKNGHSHVNPFVDGLRIFRAIIRSGFTE
jgi:glycosyltransferase involved in cell wall biosynthesis